MQDTRLLAVMCTPSLQQALQDHYSQIEIAPNYEETVRRIASGSCNIAVIEMGEAVGDMVATLQKILELPARPPVIVATASSDPTVLAQLFDMGVFGLISLPAKSAKIKEIVQAAWDINSGEDRLQVISATPSWLEVVIPAQMPYLGRLVSFLEAMIADIPEQDGKRLIYAFRELVQNAMEHGCGFAAAKSVTVRYIKTGRAIMFQVEDQGPGFDLNSMPHAVGTKKNIAIEVTRYRKTCGMRPGGLGISTILNIADELVYNQQGNAVMMIKYFFTTT